MNATSWHRKSWWCYPFFSIGLLLLSVSFDPAGMDEPLSTGSVATDSDVTKLLELTAKHEKTQDFVEPIKRLAKKRGWEREFAKSRKLWRTDWDEASASAIQVGRASFVVILLKVWDHAIPGTEVQTALLLTEQGKFLDQISCEINSRLTHMHWGELHTVIPSKPEPDGAQLIIRLDGMSARGNFSHHLDHGNEKLEFYWGNDKLPENQPSRLDATGLCRIAIKDMKFQVLFPTKQEKSLKK